MREVKGLIFSDIDGTLLDSNNQISERTRRGILKLEQRGILFVLVSARMPDGMTGIRDMLGNHAPMAAYSGGLILDADGGVLNSRTMSHERAVELKALFDREFPELCCNTYGGSLWVVDDDSDPRVKAEEAITSLKATVGPVEKLFAGRGVHKFLLMGRPEEILRAKERIGRLCPDLSLGASKPEYLEVMDGAVQKSEAVRFLCGHFGIPAGQAVAFGDGDNDLSMLRAVGRGYAMANAPLEVTKGAPYLAPDNDHEGVLTVLEELFGGCD